MRLWFLFPLTIIAAACGPKGFTSVSESKVLGTLSDSDRTQLCRDAIEFQSQHYTADAAHRAACGASAQGVYLLTKDATKCHADFDTCMAKPADPRPSESQMPKEACSATSFPFKPTCTNTVADFARCYEALGRMTDQQAMLAPQCTDMPSTVDTSACDFLLPCISK